MIKAPCRNLLDILLSDKCVMMLLCVLALGEISSQHEDLNDLKQTVFIPGIKTNAMGEDTNTNHTLASEKSVVNDRVYYYNLVPGYTYTLYGTLHDQKDETVIIPSEMIDEEGNVIDGYTFTVPEDAETNEQGGVDGSVVIRMQFDSKYIEGTTIVAFEDLDHNGKEVATHSDIEDESQTVYVPKIRTTATDDQTLDHISFADPETTITDVVSYEGLEVGKVYRMYGSVVNKITNEDGTVSAEVIPSTMFIGGDEDGKAEAESETNAEAETETKAADETDANASESEKAEGSDETQNADQTETKDNETTDNATEETPAEGSDADAETTEETQTANRPSEGTIVNYVEFIPTTRDGKINIHLKVDTSNLKSGSIVIYEKLNIVEKETGEDGEEGEREETVGVHEDPNDPDQTIVIPKISTTATADDTKTHETQASAKTVITDVVRYENLIPGKKYRMSGTLYSKTTGKPFVTSDQKPFTKTIDFTPEEANGEVSLSFEISTATLAGKSIVVFEECEMYGSLTDDGDNGKTTTVAVHKDIEDKDQTVNIIDLKTSAKDQKSGTKEVEALKEAVVVDTITYTGLTAGKQYKVSGTLIDKSTGKAATAGGKTITAETTFTPDSADGTVDVTFKFDATSLAGKSLVAFEKLFDGETEIGRHEDVNDEEQTVSVIKISTKLTGEGGAKEVPYGETVTVTDTVSYTGLTPGKSYTVRGELMDKATKKGTGITAEQTFTPENANGTVALNFSVDTTKYEGKSLVAFEKLYDANNVLVASHEDIEDKDQTITVGKKPNTPSNGGNGGGSSTPNGGSSDDSKTLNKPTTGDTNPVGAYVGFSLAALAILLFVIYRKRRAVVK